MDARLIHSGMTKVIAFNVNAGAIPLRPFDYAQGYVPRVSTGN